MTAGTRLIVDGQIFQTAAKDRGMGRYSACMLRALATVKEYNSIEVVISKNAPDAKEDERWLKDSFNNVTVTQLDLFRTENHKIEDAFKQNEGVLADHIGKQPQKSDFLILSLFQEPVVSVFPSGVRKLLLFYDLVPYLYHNRYETSIPFKNYLKRFKYLFEADQIFTISQTVADDLKIYLGMPESRLTCIDGAAIPSASKEVKPELAIPEDFILMPTSDDIRKNNLKAVLGFEEFRITENSNCKLVITSHISPEEQAHLGAFSDNLVFTGNLSDGELDWLYRHCEAVLFVPEYEGLGLPVLEAVEAGKQIVCSSISVFKEMSDDAFCYCDHEDVSSIARAIGKALSSTSPKTAYGAVKRHYTWPKTAKRFEAGLNKTGRKETPEKLKIAVFVPVPHGLSAVGKVVAESHAVMSEYFEIDYFAEPGLSDAQVRPNFLQYVAPMYPAHSFGAKAYQDYEAVIYHIGNGNYHMNSIKNALYLPGYAIIHDTNIQEAYRVLEETGIMAPARLELEAKLDNNNGGRTFRLTSILNRQLGILTHSDYAMQAARSVTRNEIPIVKANLPTAIASQPAVKRSGKVTIGLAGIIADIKGVDIIESLAKDPNFKDCIFMVFGFSFTAKETINRLNSYDNMSVITDLTDFEFHSNLDRLDIFVNYRHGYNGETSLSTIEAMRGGVAVVVKNIGWYGELPDDVVIKVDDVSEITGTLKTLTKSRDEIKLIGAKAKEHIKSKFSHEQYVLKLRDLISEARQSKSNPNGDLAKKISSGKVKTRRQYVNLLGSVPSNE
jgi:glycosyltransferase involved in cell wall biosynthesis